MRLAGNGTGKSTALLWILIGLSTVGWLLSLRPVRAQSPASSGADLDSQLDPYQRSGKIYYHKLMGKSGVERGQHIYYLKCWICHNEYAIESDPKNAAPTLKGLYLRSQLRSGKPVNDEN